LTAVIAVGVGWIAFHLVPTPLPELTRQQFLGEVQAGYVHNVVIESDVITGVSSARGPFEPTATPAFRPA
jgi:hypothetical protein